MHPKEKRKHTIDKIGNYIILFINQYNENHKYMVVHIPGKTGSVAFLPVKGHLDENGKIFPKFLKRVQLDSRTLRGQKRQRSST